MIQGDTMSKQYLAHIAADGRTESVLQHLSETAAAAASFADAFGASEQGYLAGLMHDIGKYSDAFQARLRGSQIAIDHSTAGAWECAQHNQPIAAFAVAGHHTGLPNGGSRCDNPDKPTFHARMKRAQLHNLENYDPWTQDIQFPKNCLVPAFLKTPAELSFFIRMLYSCLVDADFLCTEQFMCSHNRNTAAPSITELTQRLDAKTQKWYPPQTELNKQRCNILSRCRSEGTTLTPGLFTLTVPTGGGKTIASLAFALEHARAHHLKRIIYVIPYTSIIEQNAQVFRDCLGDEAVLEHHSGIQYYTDRDASELTVKLAKATENWDMPIIVTTAVQFFESLYSYKSSTCRKLHNLAESVIIFDEAQMLPIPYLRPCVYAISQLTAHYHATAVLCTATQPALNPIFQEFRPDHTPIEICPADIYDTNVFKRTTIRLEDKLSWNELSSRMNNMPQVLCIVNSRKAAQKIFSKLNPEHSYHLSTMMCPVHRQKILDEIRHNLQHGLPCRVVSTSLIEAGVDVDFPAVFREETGLDSILQAAGRCNREGKRSAADSIVTVFQGEDPAPSIFAIQTEAFRIVKDTCSDITSTEAIALYFRKLLELKGRHEQDQKDIMVMMNRPDLPFREISDNFHLIETTAHTIYIPTGDGAALVQQLLQQPDPDKHLFRKLDKYSVSVYDKQFDRLVNTKSVRTLPNEAAILTDMSLYSQQIGLIYQ